MICGQPHIKYQEMFPPTESKTHLECNNLILTSYFKLNNQSLGGDWRAVQEGE